jgi:hypothetical protein
MNLTKFGTRLILVNLSNLKFGGNPLRRSQLLSCAQAKIIGAFIQLLVANMTNGCEL